MGRWSCVTVARRSSLSSGPSVGQKKILEILTAGARNPPVLGFCLVRLPLDVVAESLGMFQGIEKLPAYPLEILWNARTLII